MSVRVSVALFAAGLLLLLLVSIGSAYATSLLVPDSNLEQQTVPVRAEDIKPAACSAIHLSNIVRGSGVFSGTDGNDLIIGSAGPDVIDGAGGDDCILGSQGDDVISGGDGADVCVGGYGADTFASCEDPRE
jgi:Ca2+-binding RTX toxin-like protein